MHELKSEFAEVGSWRACHSPITSITFIRGHRHSTALAVGDAKLDLKLWQPPMGTEDVPVLLNVMESGIAIGDICAVSQRQGWQGIGAVGGGSEVRLYNAGDSDTVQRIRVPGERLHRVAAMRRHDGTAAVIVGADNRQVRVWNVDDGEITSLPDEEIDERHGKIHAIRIFPRQQWLVTVRDAPRGIALFDLSQRVPQLLRSFGTGDDHTATTYYDPLDQPVLVTGGDRGIRIWDAHTGSRLGSLARGHAVSRVIAVTGRNGELLLIASHEDEIRVWNPYTDTSALLLTAQRGHRITAMSGFNSDHGSALVAVGTNKGFVHLLRQELQSTVRRQQIQHRSWVNAVAVELAASTRQSHPLVATASDDGEVRVWDRASGAATTLPTVIEDLSAVQALTFLPSGGLAAGRESGRIDLWTRPGDQGHLPVKTGRPSRQIRTMISAQVGGNTVLISAGEVSDINVWDPQDLTAPIHTMTASAATDSAQSQVVRSLATVALPGGSVLAAAHSDGRIHLWNMSTWQPCPVGLAPTPDQCQIRKLVTVQTPAATYLAAGCDDGLIRLWNMDWALADSERSAEDRDAVEATIVIDSGHGVVSALAALPPGSTQSPSHLSLLASGGSDGVIRLWDVSKPEEPYNELGRVHSNWVRALAFQTIGPSTALISGGADGSVRSWPLQGGRIFPWSSFEPIGRGFADRPARVEMLDRMPLVDALVDTLRLPSAEPGLAHTAPPNTASGPKVIAIQGRWGSGKTSLMRMLQDKLDSLPPQQRGSKREITPSQALRILRKGMPTTSAVAMTDIATVWFNPWSHQTSPQVWSGLAWTMFEQTRDRFGPNPADRQRFWLGHNLSRLDRGRIARSLRTRVWAPAVATVTALIAPLVTVLARNPNAIKAFQPRQPGWQDAALIAGSVLAALGLTLLGITAYRYWRGSAAAHLPEDLLDGPLPPALSLGDQWQSRLGRENSPHTHSGALFWLQRDVSELVTELNRRGVQLVVFIDDLDRCAAATTQEVFEAVSGILSDQYDSRGFDQNGHTGVRFILGLDPDLVAHLLDQSDQARSARPGGQNVASAIPRSLIDPDDPSAGWATLRKLWQLSVVLPPTPVSHAARLMGQHLPAGASVQSGEAGTSGATHVQADSSGTATVNTAGGQTASRPVASFEPPLGEPGLGDLAGDGEPVVIAQRGSASNDTQRAEAYYFGAPVPTHHMSNLLAQRPYQSMRETKRMLTMWGFLMRLKRERARLGLSAPISTRQHACDVMTLAEIITRWPSMVSILTQWHLTDGEPQSVLSIMVKTVADGDAEVTLDPLLPEDLRPLGPHLVKVLRRYACRPEHSVVELAEELLCGGVVQNAYS
ncbi:P-loop NTPase fold protein [Catellatospora paridis]|uniref:P-loop NTPase fold protein n=1 Tax=Catellatospora paridis TaxID=1617086 RepID=UPI0012D40863|nr:P-loop NTPase fold protein [Catellatospora paridis]